VAPFREKSLFWHQLWIANDRPRSGIIADIMRRTRAQYHYAIRSVNKNRDDIVNERFATAMITNNDRDFWREAKRLRNSKVGCSNNVDGLSSPNDIAQLFATKYEDLYTSVPYNCNDMDSIRNSINSDLFSSGYNKDCIVSPDEVRLAVQKLKPGKNDGCIGLSSDYFIHACTDLFVHIAMLFSALLVHGTAPGDLSSSTVIPIPKGKNTNLCISANYRGITLSSIFGKVFDRIILSRFSDKLCVSDLQFGFRPKRSTDMCTMLLKETIAYYINNDSPVYCVMLDATKAFDRVNYCKLFREVMKRSLPAPYVRLMLNMYTNHITRVAWNGVYSNSFKVLNGVKQGAIISPILFCIYLDGLLCRLRDSGVGCFVGSIFVGALAYADDLSLLSPTPSGIRQLLSICESYAREFDIVFNGAKSKCIFIAPPKYRASTYGPNPQFKISGQDIEYVDHWPHLGHIVTKSNDDEADITFRRNRLCGQINNVLCFFHRRGPIVKAKLLTSYCYSFYGSVLWDLSHPCIDSFCCTWRKGLRRALGLPADTSSRILPGIMGTLPILDELARRTTNFVQACLSSDSDTVRSITVSISFNLMSARENIML
jgi:hypothetical protein